MLSNQVVGGLGFWPVTEVSFLPANCISKRLGVWQSTAWPPHGRYGLLGQFSARRKTEEALHVSGFITKSSCPVRNCVRVCSPLWSHCRWFMAVKVMEVFLENIWLLYWWGLFQASQITMQANCSVHDGVNMKCSIGKICFASEFSVNIPSVSL